MPEVKVSQTQLYLAFFNRAPDPEDFSFWIAARELGFYIEATAAGFADQAETYATYPYLADPRMADRATLLNSVFQNVINRDADTRGPSFGCGKRVWNLDGVSVVSRDKYCSYLSQTWLNDVVALMNNRPVTKTISVPSEAGRTFQTENHGVAAWLG